MLCRSNSLPSCTPMNTLLRTSLLGGAQGSSKSRALRVVMVSMVLR